MLKELREQLNDAMRRKEYEIAAEACRQIIALDARAKALNILVFLYHKDLGEIYIRLHEYEKALASLQTARDGLLHHRATQKLKYPEDWLAELKAIEKLIHKVETVYL